MRRYNKKSVKKGLPRNHSRPEVRLGFGIMGPPLSEPRLVPWAEEEEEDEEEEEEEAGEEEEGGVGRRLEAVRCVSTLQRETRNLGPHLPPSTTPSRVAFEVTAPKVVENEGEVVMQDNNFPPRRRRPRRRHHRRRRRRRRVSSSSGNSEERELRPVEGRDAGVNAAPSTLSSLPNLRTPAACWNSGLQGLGNVAEAAAAAATGSCSSCQPTGRGREAFREEHRAGSETSCGCFFASCHDQNPSTLALQWPAEMDECSRPQGVNDPTTTCSLRNPSHAPPSRSNGMIGEGSDRRTSASPASHISHTSGPQGRCGHSSRPSLPPSHIPALPQPHTAATGSPAAAGHVSSSQRPSSASSPPLRKRSVNTESLGGSRHHSVLQAGRRSPEESQSQHSHTQRSVCRGSPPPAPPSPRHAQPGGALPPSVRSQPCGGQAATPLRAGWWPLLLTPPLLLLLLLLPPTVSPTELDEEGEARGYGWL